MAKQCHKTGSAFFITNPIKTVMMRTFLLSSSTVICLYISTHTHAHTLCPFKSQCYLPYLGKKGVSSLWQTPKKEELRRKKHWKHIMTFHQTHALMQSWLDSMAVFVLMSIWWLWELDFLLWHVRYCIHPYLLFLFLSKWHQLSSLAFFLFLQLSKAEEYQLGFGWVNWLVAVLNIKNKVQ